MRRNIGQARPLTNKYLHESKDQQNWIIKDGMLRQYLQQLNNVHGHFLVAVPNHLHDPIGEDRVRTYRTTLLNDN